MISRAIVSENPEKSALWQNLWPKRGSSRKVCFGRCLNGLWRMRCFADGVSTEQVQHEVIVEQTVCTEPRDRVSVRCQMPVARAADPGRYVSSRMRILRLAFSGSVLIASLLLIGCDADRSTKPEVTCFANLKQIDAGKQMWVIEQHKTTKDVPTWDDLRTYFRGEVPPKCPNGGSYTIGRVGDMPTCSVAEHTAAYRTKRP